ncbi:hypothetical protein [Bosea sp. CS1GBMeth4]|uniref:hypothetical protein n=1 Tax=Bosea sp. CS1GBMeth4 TaxID=1892849 RepID=UPI001646E6F6|nr:hypothetical protein [Bosea sp. CS1GBMeth4]
MSPPRNRERLLVRVAACAALIGVAWLAFQAIGWLGVGLVGLFTLFVAVRYELEGDLPVGSQMTPDLYAGQFGKSDREHAAERAGRHHEWLGRLSAARLAAGLGALLALSGFGIFFGLEFGR